MSCFVLDTWQYVYLLPDIMVEELLLLALPLNHFPWEFHWVEKHGFRSTLSTFLKCQKADLPGDGSERWPSRQLCMLWSRLGLLWQDRFHIPCRSVDMNIHILFLYHSSEHYILKKKKNYLIKVNRFVLSNCTIQFGSIEFPCPNRKCSEI